MATTTNIDTVSHSSISTPGPIRRWPNMPSKSTRECCICCKYVDKEYIIRPCRCEMRWCRFCLEVVFTNAVDNAQFSPPRCCDTLLQLHTVLPHLDPRTAAEYRSCFKSWLAADKIFCPASGCIALIAKKDLPATGPDMPRSFSCPQCTSEICTTCRCQAHEGSCDAEETAAEGHTLAKLSVKYCHGCYQATPYSYNCSTYLKCDCGGSGAVTCWICGLSSESNHLDCAWDFDDPLSFRYTKHGASPYDFFGAPWEANSSNVHAFSCRHHFKAVRLKPNAPYRGNLDLMECNRCSLAVRPAPERPKGGRPKPTSAERLMQAFECRICTLNVCIGCKFRYDDIAEPRPGHEEDLEYVDTDDDTNKPLDRQGNELSRRLEWEDHFTDLY